MRKLLLAITIMASANIMAAANTCLAKLTYDFSIDSRAFKVDTDNINVIGNENDYLAQGISIVRGVLDLHGCDGQDDINFGHGPLGRTKSSCEKLVRSRGYSLTCYIESNLGFFFVTRDLQTNAFVVFSRWD